MPRTVPKTVARTGRAAKKKASNRKARFMKSYSPEKGSVARHPAAARVDQRTRRRRRVRRPKKRSEEEEREVRGNAEDPRVSPMRSATRSLSALQLQGMEAARRRSKGTGSGQNHDSKTWRRPSFRTFHARNPCDSQARREFFGDDAQESCIDQRCSGRIDKRTTRRPRAARRAKRP